MLLSVYPPAHDVLRFVADLAIPPTSNQAERDLRPAKTQEKISGRLQSKQTIRRRYAIRSYLPTASKHQADVLTALRDAITGNPWMPPIPAQPRPPAPAPAGCQPARTQPAPGT